jgi:hypothetical protein
MHLKIDSNNKDSIALYLRPSLNLPHLLINMSIPIPNNNSSNPTTVAATTNDMDHRPLFRDIRTRRLM